MNTQCVYFGAGGDDGRVVIAATTNISASEQDHRRDDPAFKLLATLATEQALACQKYLHETYASRRLAGSAPHAWFAIEGDEVDHAIRLWRKRQASLEQSSRLVSELKVQRTLDQQLEPNATDVRCYTQLKQVRAELEALTLEKERLETELKLRIGRYAGLRGLVSWGSQQSRRFDLSTFRTQHPDLYEQFRRPSVTRYFRLS